VSPLLPSGRNRFIAYLKIDTAIAYISLTDRFTQFGLRSDADEQLRRAVRDGFRRAGLNHAQLTQAMEWYRDRGQHMSPDPAKLTESFTEFAASKHWPPEHRSAALSVYGAVRDQGPAAVIAPTSAEQDAATIARATELLRTDQAAYWRDVELQEANFEALQRRESAGAAVEAAVPGPTTPSPAPRPRPWQPVQSAVSTSNAMTIS
jgi:hypothetical protein